jgi:hypothetical protein
MATRGRATMLAAMAKARRARAVSAPWIPTEEQSRAIAEGTLIVIGVACGPILIDLSAEGSTP